MKRFSEYIGSQFGNPRGAIGKLCCIIMNKINKAMYESIVTNIKLYSHSTLLDIGYGNGYLIQKIYKKFGSNIVGIDISEDMKNIASKRNSEGIAINKIQLLLGNCCELNFDNNTFEAVTSVNTIYFWNDTEKGLSEIYNVLKSGGIFYNAVYSKKWLQKLSYTKKGFKLFNNEDLISLGKKVGFSEISIKDISNGKSYIIQYKK